MEKSIGKFENHPSILSINGNVNVEQPCQFSEIISEGVLSEINNLDSKRAGSYKNIPSKILKETSKISSERLAKIWNEQVIRSKNFPNELKLADIIPILKKKLILLSIFNIAKKPYTSKCISLYFKCF